MKPYILAVCTGNICRSPALERMLRRDLGDAVAVTSAGTSARVGEHIHPPIAEIMVGDGLSPSHFTARALTAADVTDAALVLTATTEHRSEVVRLVPSAVRRTFTLLELARLVSTVPEEALPDATTDRLAAIAALANAQRGRHLGSWSRDLADPYGARPRKVATIYRELSAAEATVAAVLAQRGRHLTES
ncbi:protein-tyrosine phosphatase [Sediminihabitans luteus]|uniref:protein-tyrosine-phosphatase n=1 Tax=Sediminihabitans luteus TaxID=1138585 RepID=A0A2M9CD78_9CELL|nr:low molecular weight phosphatase family protein [Sediminihabitans luteus]PJJ69881.1 protein-tyrosine phosphatase [Sediminihabitans luteus]GII99200.1 protein-tyrosine-phosphatase [Sediminihabitans luteus]